MQSETSLWKPPQRWFPTRISKQFSFWKTSEILNRRKQRSSQFQFCFGKLRRYRKGELVKPVLKALVIQSISVNPSISLLSIPLVVTMKASVLFLIRWDIFEKIIKSLSFPCCAVSKNTPQTILSLASDSSSFVFCLLEIWGWWENLLWVHRG